MNKTLYVTDLDGTLLDSDQKVSSYSCSVINDLVARGMIFSYATARSMITARKATVGLNAQMPLIVYNGTFVIDNVTGQRLISNTFSAAEAAELLEILQAHDIAPLVYSLQADVEKFSYIPSAVSPGLRRFLDSRQGDVRDHPVSSAADLSQGEIYYFTNIDEPSKLVPVYEELRDRYNCMYQKDVYSDDMWLEILPKAASKASAILQVKELYGCDRIVAFGDGLNDLPMFEIADEGYAVSNAVDELKAIATGIIKSNNADGVAKWLSKHVIL
jgi:Cof subfamily protein (haloacid dehalogenase superfamily)